MDPDAITRALPRPSMRSDRARVRPAVRTELGSEASVTAAAAVEAPRNDLTHHPEATRPLPGSGADSDRLVDPQSRELLYGPADIGAAAGQAPQPMLMQRAYRVNAAGNDKARSNLVERKA